MNNVMNNFSGLVSCPFPFSFFLFFFLQVHQLGLSLFFSFKESLYVYFLIIMKAYIVYTQKVANIIYICKKKNCTNFTNVYNICQFLCVYNINLHCKCNVYFYI